jgi:hypothetical protein
MHKNYYILRNNRLGYMFRSLREHHQTFLRIKSVNAAYMLRSQNVQNCYNLISKNELYKFHSTNDI